MKKRTTALLLCAALLLGLAACRGAAPQKITRTSFMLDTVINITLYNWKDEETLTRAMAEIARLENLLSLQKEGSDLDRLAKAAGQDWVEISPECEEVLRLAKEYQGLSQGYFDVTAGPLIALWNIKGDRTGHYPTPQELAAAMTKTNGDKLLIEPGRAILQDPGMEANLGAIAKGYIADQVKALLIAEGVEYAILDLGRNLLLIGGNPQGGDFLIGVQSPFQEAGEVVAVIKATGKSIVTSGINERYFEYEGVRYHHILDPFTGYPAQNGLASVTILSDSSAAGDALSTTCFLLGPEKGRNLIESLPDIEALFILEDGTQVESSGFSAYRGELP